MRVSRKSLVYLLLLTAMALAVPPAKAKKIETGFLDRTRNALLALMPPLH